MLKYFGTESTALSNYPNLKSGYTIIRKYDGQEQKVSP